MFSKEKPIEYTIDITKPPVAPPLREFGIFNKETKTSRINQRNWDLYIKCYRMALENSRKNEI